MSAHSGAGATIDGAYVLDKSLGRGGFATVWKARTIATGELVAIKLFHPGLLTERRMERARLEAELLLRLDHPNIGSAKAIHLDHNTPYLVLELIEGEPLNALIRRRCGTGHHFALRDIRSMMRQLCSAVGFAAECGVVHRDLKPQNIICAGVSEPELKVIDFGIARLLDLDADRATTQGRVLGSVFYMAPEQARGGAVDARADVFAVGSILFELLTLRRAWAFAQDGERALAFSRPVSRLARNSPLQVLEETSRGERPRPSRYRPSLPESVDQIVARATASDPAERYASVAELWAELEQALPLSDDADRLSAEDQALTRLATRLAMQGDALDATPVASAPSSSDPEIAATYTLPDAPRSESGSQVHPAPAPRPRRNSVPWVAALIVGLLFVGLIAVGAQIKTTGSAGPVAGSAPTQAEAVAPPLTAVVVPAVASTATTSAKVTKAPPPETPVAKRPKPLEPRARANRRPDPAAPKPPVPANRGVSFAKLHGLVDRARSDPNDVDALKLLRRGILEASRTLPDESAARRIRRLTESSSMLGDVDGLARALRELEASSGAE